MSYDAWFAQLQQEIHKHRFAHVLLGLAQYDIPSAWLEAYLWGYSPAEAWEEELTHWGF